MENEPIRVLEVIGEMDLGGAESMIMNLYRCIDREKVQFDFLVHTQRKCAFDDEIEQLGGRIFHITKFNGRNAIRYYRECNKFFDQHPEIRVVHGHIGSSAALYLHAANKHGCYTIAHSHAANKITDFKSVVWAFFSFPTRYIAKQLFGCSTEAGQARYGKRAVASKKYKNFNNAIDVSRYAYDYQTRIDMRKSLGIDKDEILIGTVGRVSHEKNPEMIYGIFESLAERKEDTRCIWIGSGEFEDTYRRKIIDSGHTDRIIMTGRRNDIPQLLQAMDVLILPSFFEGLPVTIIEAQAASLPCVLSDTISRETAVTDLVTWKSIKDSPEQWADECINIAKSTMHHRTDKKQELVNAGYDIKETAKWLGKFYMEMHNTTIRK